MHDWEATEEPGFLGEKAALVPEPVLDGADLQDGWWGLGEPRNPDDFWVTGMGLVDGDCCQATGYLVRSSIPALCSQRLSGTPSLPPLPLPWVSRPDFPFLGVLKLCVTIFRTPVPCAQWAAWYYIFGVLLGTCWVCRSCGESQRPGDSAAVHRGLENKRDSHMQLQGPFSPACRWLTAF